MDTAVSQAFLQLLKDERFLKDYAFVAASALVIYDYLLTIHDEVKLVWFSPWAYTKVLFLLTRYVPISNMYFYLYVQLSLDAQPQSCTQASLVNTGLLITGIILAEIILMIRTWAVWRRDWRLGVFLVAVLTGGILSSSINANQFLKSLKAVAPPYSRYRGCSSSQATSGQVESLFQTFITLAVMDAVVLGLMMTSAVRAYRLGNKTELMNVIHKDAISFYTYMLTCSMASAIVAHVWPDNLTTLLAPFQSTIHSILTCRIVVNIRSVAGQGQTGSTIGLHSDLDGCVGIGELRFENPSVDLVNSSETC